MAWFWWAFFGNDDDGLFGDERWRSGRPETVWLAVIWWLRNPFHNLTWYVIGVADKHRTVYSNKDSDAPGWCFMVTRCGWLWLPFVGHNGFLKFYAGWRPSGAFGLKFNIKFR